MKYIIYIFFIVVVLLEILELSKVIRIKIRDKNTRILFVAPSYRYIFSVIGSVLCALNYIFYMNTDTKALLYISLACLLGVVNELNHYYIAKSSSTILINGREYTLEQAEKYGRQTNMRVLQFETIYEIETGQYRSYVYLDKKVDIHNLLYVRSY